MRRTLALLLPLIAACEPLHEQDAAPTAPPVDAQAAIDHALTLPGVREAIVTENAWLYLGMADTHADRTAFAVGVCRGLQGKQVQGIVAVKVVDYAYVLAKRGFRELGSAYC